MGRALEKVLGGRGGIKGGAFWLANKRMKIFKRGREGGEGGEGDLPREGPTVGVAFEGIPSFEGIPLATKVGHGTVPVDGGAC